MKLLIMQPLPAPPPPPRHLLNHHVRDWIHIAQDKDRWRALVNAVMNLRIP